MTCPTLAIHSREDHVVPAANGRRIAQEVSSQDVRLLWLDNSYHVATLDNDKDLIVDRCGRSFVKTMLEVPCDHLFSIGAAIRLLALHQAVDTLQRLQHDISNCCYSNLKRNMSELQMQVS